MDFKYAFAVIEKETNFCSQTLQTNNGHFIIDNDSHYSMSVDVEYATAYPGKYYYNNQWWSRKWDEVDEYGIPVEGSTYVDTKWNP